eukprot:220039_1
MAATNGLTDKIDNGLAGYYAQNHRWDYANETGTGKFKEFVEISGFEDDDVAEELAGEAEDCTLTEFDLDDDGNNQFPFEESIEDEEQQTAEIFRLLNHYAKLSAEQGTDNIAIHVANFLGITEEQMKRTVKKHVTSMMTPFQESTQEQNMKKLIDKFSKNRDLLYFLSVAERTQYPFLTYIVDSYTRANATHFAQHKETLGMSVWIEKLSFYQKLKAKDKETAVKLISAMHSYSSRVMRRINFNPMIKIRDNLKEICQYIASIPTFIHQIVDKLDAATPFQVDLTIAVRQVGLAVTDEKSDDDDDDDIDDDNDDNNGNGVDEKQLDPDVDHIGDVKRKLQGYPMAHLSIKAKEKISTALSRVLGSGWGTFRTALSEFVIISNGQPDNDPSDEEPDDYVEKSLKLMKDEKRKLKSFPQNRRFGIFVDRREANKESLDQVYFYLHPNDCNTIQHDHVAETGFDLLRRCIIPDSENNEKYINSVTNVCGQLITFMFSVEQQNEIRCYLVWNGQTMRFHEEHMSEVLPLLFEESEENIEFIKENEELKRLEKIFRDEMKDDIYEKFYKSLN